MSLQAVINDHRINPRVPLQTLVTVLLGEQHLELQAENISISGIMLTASQDQFNQLLHREDSSGINVQPEVHICFTMSGQNTPEIKVEALCRAIHVRRMSQNKYYVGLKYLKLNQAAAAAIQHYVQAHL